MTVSPCSTAPVALPNEYLTLPSNCSFGCIPDIKTATAAGAQAIAGRLPWRGKCFTPAAPAAPAEMVAEPTLPDGNVSDTPVPLIAYAINLIEVGRCRLTQG